VSAGASGLGLDGVRFRYARAAPWVLDDVSLEVAPGEIVAIFGPNGAGKSTLLRVAAGDLAPEAGAVRIAGRPAAAQARRELARAVATVPQDALVTFPYTVGEVVLMGRAPHVGRFALEGPEDLEAARVALEAVDLWPLRDRPILEVSGGERQRAALARALAQATPVLVLDEPTAHLDIRHAVDTFRVLRRVALERRAAVLLATHDLSLAAQYADRAALLAAGRIAAAGAPADVLDPARLRSVFGVDVDVARHSRTGRPYVVFGGD